MEGEIVGMLAMKKTERILDQLFVAPKFHRQGVDRLLLVHAMEEMAEGFTLRTASSNLGARAFYERMGLEFLSEGEHPLDGQPVCYYGWKVR